LNADLTVGATIVARNYLPYARVLAAGWRRHHPGLPLHVLVIDASPGHHENELDVLVPGALGIDDAALASLRGIYDASELATALKPQLLRHLLDIGADAVVYLDSDVDVHAGLNGVAALARQHSTVLTPHFLRPLPDDGLSPSEVDMRLTGVYNSGILAVGPGGRAFLDWWARRVRLDALRAEDAGMHGDQRWLDYVPSCFEHLILRDPAVNVAAWNLHERRLGHGARGFTVDGEPLRAFHFSGYGPRHPSVPDPAKWPRPRRFQVAPGSPIERLCLDYGDRLVDAGYWEARRAGYAYAHSAAGTALDFWERRAYRELVIACEAHGLEAPNPFDPAQSEAFEDFLADPGANPLLSRAARARLAYQLLATVRRAGRVRAVGRLPAAGRLMAGARPSLRRNGEGPALRAPHPETSDRTRLEYDATA
jgi:hypothetical protein